MKESGRFVVPRSELIDMYAKQPFLQRGDQSQLMLRLLKEDGAPVNGTLALSWDDRYEFRRRVDLETQDLIIEWRKADDPSKSLVVAGTSDS